MNKPLVRLLRAVGKKRKNYSRKKKKNTPTSTNTTTTTSDTQESTVESSNTKNESAEPQPRAPPHPIEFYLNWHFFLTFYLLLVQPTIDLLVVLPSELIMPRKEYLHSLLVAGGHILLLLISNTDIYQLEAYQGQEYCYLEATARFTFGIALGDLLLLTSQLAFLYISWPYIFKQIRYSYYYTKVGPDFADIFRRLSLKFEAADAEEGMHRVQLVDAKITDINDDGVDLDALVLLAAQSVRLVVVVTKLLVGRQCRLITCKVNRLINSRHHSGLPVPAKALIYIR